MITQMFSGGTERDHPATLYLFKVNNNKNTRKRCEICSKLTIKHQNDNDVNDVTVFLLLTLNIFYTFF